jgi:hypothetical protein
MVRGLSVDSAGVIKIEPKRISKQAERTTRWGVRYWILVGEVELCPT